MNNLIRSLFLGLSGKIRIVVGICFLITMIVLGLFIYTNIEANVIGLNRSELENVAKLVHEMTDLYVKSTIENYLSGIAEKARNLAEFYESRVAAGELTATEARARFRAVIIDSPFGRIGRDGYIATLDINGIALMHPDRAVEGRDLTGLEVMQAAIREREGFMHYLWEEESPTGEGPILREKAAALHYFAPWQMLIWVTTYKEDAFQLLDQEELRHKLARLKIGEKGYAFIMDTSGKLIIHPDEKLENDNISLNTDSQGKYYIQEILEQVTAPAGEGEEESAAGTKAAGEPGEAVPSRHGVLLKEAARGQPIPYSFFYPGEDNEQNNPRNRLGACTFYPEMNWVLFASSDVREVYNKLNAIKNTSILISLIAFVIWNLAVALIIYLILKPINEMKRVVTQIAGGDLSPRIDILSNDEIGEMSEQFNTLLDNFEKVLHGIKNSSASLLDSVQGLSVSSQEISSTSNEQAAAVKEIVSTMEDSDTLAKSIADKINDVAHIALKMKETVDNGFSIIKNSLAKMDEIKSSNSATIVGVQALSDKIGSIWEIVNIINGIADQTKIIAFNAELEASAAGEAGKNFQIVATEIRRLADNTVSSTNEIRAKINEIQHSSDTLIISSEEGTAKIKEGWSLSNELQQVFEDILQSSEISANSAEQIALSINQQVSAFEQILLTLRQISEGIDNFVDSTKTTTAESDKLKQMADSLNATITQYITNDGDREL